MPIKKSRIQSTLFSYSHLYYFYFLLESSTRCCAALSRPVVSDSLWPHGLWPTRLLCPRGSPRKNTGVGCQALLQGIFPTQGSNPGILHCRWILYSLEPPGKPKKTRVGNLSLLQGNGTWVSCIVGGFFTSWTTREAPSIQCEQDKCSPLRITCLTCNSVFPLLEFT